MQLPEPLYTNLQKLLTDFSLDDLESSSKQLMLHYKHQVQLKSSLERMAYLAMRMPATYAAIYSVLSAFSLPVKSLLDLGSGPGTVGFAAREIWKEVSITCIEQDPLFIDLAKKLDAPGEIQTLDLNKISQFSFHDLVIFSYSFGELSIHAETILEKAWGAAAKALVIIEPGTPTGYGNVLKARNYLIECGAYIHAPCFHEKPCPLSQGDWCHFSAKVERSFFHKRAKSGTLPFEDEKFSYLIVTKEKPKHLKNSRILRPPLKKSGHVYLQLCQEEGKSLQQIVSKKTAEKYRAARKAKWGDSF